MLSVLMAPPYLQLINPVVLMIIMTLDALDGLFARLFHQETLFGAMFDIVADHIIEILLWVVLAMVNMVPLWVVIVFLVRDITVDSIRSYVAKKGKAPFKMFNFTWGHFLVSGRFMRFLYGSTKCITFAWLLFLQPVPMLFREFWISYEKLFTEVSTFLIYSSVILCLIRGLPVIGEWLLRELQN